MSMTAIKTERATVTLDFVRAEPVVWIGGDYTLRLVCDLELHVKLTVRRPSGAECSFEHTYTGGLTVKDNYLPHSDEPYDLDVEVAADAWYSKIENIVRAVGRQVESQDTHSAHFDWGIANLRDTLAHYVPVQGTWASEPTKLYMQPVNADGRWPAKVWDMRMVVRGLDPLPFTKAWVQKRTNADEYRGQPEALLKILTGPAFTRLVGASKAFGHIGEDDDLFIAYRLPDGIRRVQVTL